VVTSLTLKMNAIFQRTLRSFSIQQTERQYQRLKSVY